jgi:hypothetical protein
VKVPWIRSRALASTLRTDSASSSENKPVVAVVARDVDGELALAGPQRAPRSKREQPLDDLARRTAARRLVQRSIAGCSAEAPPVDEGRGTLEENDGWRASAGKRPARLA